MKYRYLAVLIISPLVVIFDQLTKWLVLTYIPRGHEIPVIPGFFDLVHTRNTGAAFGAMAGVDAAFRVPFFYIVAAVAVVVLAVMLWKMHDDERLLPVSFGLILGGIAGNIIDRLRLGSVVDFLSFHWKDAVVDGSLFSWHINFPLYWPAFNVADSAITVAMGLLVIAAFRKPKDSV